MTLYFYLLVILPTPFIVHKWLPVEWNALSAAVHNIKLPSDQEFSTGNVDITVVSCGFPRMWNEQYAQHCWNAGTDLQHT